MADTRLGKIGITVKEPWAADISFEVLDMTLNAVENGGDGCSYVALRDNIGVTPGTDPNTWVKSTQAGQSIYDLAVKYHHFVGTEEEFEAQYQAVLQAARDAAAGASAVEAQVEAAETARVAAETGRADAESARQSAEASRASAETARGTAEAARQSAESGRASAETARASAEAGRVSAESERASAEAARAAAETDRVSDFSALKTDMETAIGQADAATAAAVATNNQIQTAETGRVSAEQGRVSAETARASAESARATAESGRATAETARATAEGQRATAEGQRVTTENARVSAESGRDTAESARVTAEANRVSAETARESQASSDHTRAESDHAIVQGYDTRLTNVEGEVSQLGQKVDKVAISVTEEGKYIKLSGNIGTVIPSATSFSSCNYSRRNVSPGDNIIINGTGGSESRLWGFVDGEQKLISAATANATAVNLLLIAPDNAAEVIINNLTSDPNNISYYQSRETPELIYKDLNENVKPEIADIQEDISDQKADVEEIDGNLNGAKVTISGWTLNYYIQNNQGVGNVCPTTPIASGALRYVIIDIAPGVTSFLITGTGTAGGRLWSFLDKDDKILSVADSDVSVSNLKLEIPEGATQLILNTMKSGAQDCYIVYDGLNNEVKALMKETPIPTGNASSLVETPSKIYGLAYANTPEFLDKLNFMHRVYIEGVAKGDYPDLRLDGGQSTFLQVEPTGGAMAEGDHNKSVRVSCKGYNDSTISIPFSLSNPYNIVGKTMRIMHIGDSLTSDGIPCATKAILDVMASDYGANNTLMVGNHKTTKDVVLSGDTISEYACHVGYGGWATSDFLRHITCTRGATTGVSAADVIYGKVAWDSIGLGTKTRNGVPGQTYVAYTGVDAQRILLRDTPHGYYDADPTAELWDWLVNKKGLTTFTYDGTTYTFGASYSSADDAAQKAAIKYLCENPENPFFDISTVESSNGRYAFNFATYLARYKTLQDDGVTRLVPGSTAGTKVVYAESWDVCSPTHIVIICAHNGYTLVKNGEGDAADMALMASLIKGYDSDIKVAVCAPRSPGAFNPNAYNWSGFYKKGEFKENLFNIYVELKELAEDATDFDFIPLYPIQSVFWGADGKSIDTMDNHTRVRYVGDGNHARSANSYLDISSEVVSWLAYLFRS